MSGGAEIILVAKPKSKLIRVAFNRLRHCPREISNVTASEPEQAQSEEHLRKSVDTAAPANNVSTDDDPVDEEHTSHVPVEEPTVSVPVEESTIDHPVEVSTTDVQVEQSTSNEDEVGGDEGNKWKDRLRPRLRKRGRRGRAP